MDESTPAEAVCTIFETLNRTGMRLFVFDLLAARFWPLNLRLRDMWHSALQAHPIIEHMGTDPYYLLQAITLLAHVEAPTCKRSDVLGLTVEQVARLWGPVSEAASHVLTMLADECGVLQHRWLPYDTILVPAMAFWAEQARQKGPQVGKAHEMLKRWYWCSVFSQAYERSPNSQAAKDLIELRRWVNGGEAPETVTRFAFDPSELDHVTVRQRALYRGVLSLMLRRGALDFHKAAKLTMHSIQELRVEDHHVFPRGWVQQHTPDHRALAESVLNRALIDKQTNILISDTAPSEYLGRIVDALGEPKTNQVLQAQLLPPATGSPLNSDAFGEFIDWRRREIGREILRVCSS